MEEVKDRFAYAIGAGSGSGSGSGYGSGYGYGYGDGSDDGSGYGYGVKSFRGETVYMIDGVQTIIKSVYGNTAKGYILNSDLTQSPCYIAKSNGEFAHGDTLKKAIEDLRDKILENMSEDERIEGFISQHKHGAKYSGEHFYDWHHKLTGSCVMGRKAFIINNHLDLKCEYTVDEFIKLTQNAYGGNTIIKLKKEWET